MNRRHSAARRLCLLAAAALAAAPLAAQIDTGSADFSRYVALGDSLTHGVVSGSIGVAGQRFSYPSLIHRQTTGGGGFEQPLVSEPGIPGRLVLTSLVPLVIEPLPGFGSPTNLALPRPYNNLGVSGFDVLDLLQVEGGPSDSVPSQLVLRGLGSAVVQAVALDASVVTVWIGNNDALGAALSGLVVEDVTLTSPATFRTVYARILRPFIGLESTIIVATIPDVTALPFVNTLPPVVVDAAGQPVLVGGSPIPLTGVRGDGSAGPLGAGDFVLLTAASSGALARGDGVATALGGSGSPLANQYVLDAAEAARISDRIRQFNDIIRAEADFAGGVVVDTNAVFDRVLQDGLVIGGIDYDASLLGGLFSFDGIHPGPLGYAIVANEFIRVINQQFGAVIEPVNLFPLVLGGEGSLGAPAGLALNLNSLQLSQSGWRNLRRLLDIPTARRIRQLERQLVAAAEQLGEQSSRSPVIGSRRVAGGRAVEQKQVGRRDVDRP